MGMRHIHIKDAPPFASNAMSFQNAAETNNVAISLDGEYGASPNIAKSTENDQDKISATDDEKDNGGSFTSGSFAIGSFTIGTSSRRIGKRNGKNRPRSALTIGKRNDKISSNSACTVSKSSAVYVAEQQTHLRDLPIDVLQSIIDFAGSSVLYSKPWFFCSDRDESASSSM
jgi:hypothetical protein